MHAAYPSTYTFFYGGVQTERNSDLQVANSKVAIIVVVYEFHGFGVLFNLKYECPRTLLFRIGVHYIL